MSLFGNTTSSAPTFSFGQQPTTSTATSAPSLFGSTPATASTAPTGGLFGGGNPSTPNSTAGGAGGLFGNTAPSTTAGTGTGLFSGLGNSAAKPAGGGFSFGNATPAPSSSAAPPTSSLFGTANTATGGGGLFGNTSTSTAGAGGLFGQPPAQSTGGGGLFGSAPSAAPNMFGTQPQQPQQSSLLQQSQQQQSTPSSGIDKQTKFQDLPDQARNLVEEMDKFIRSQGQIADDLKGKTLGQEITQTTRTYEQTVAEASTVTSLLENDHRLIVSLRHELEQSLSDLEKTTILIEGYKAGGANSSSNNTNNPNSNTRAIEAKAVAGFPYEFFTRKTREMQDRASRYRQTVDQISSVLVSPQSSLSPSSILPTLKAQHSSLLSLASSVSSLELELSRLKDEYRGIWRDKTGRLVDPFRLGASGQGIKGVETGVRGMEIR